MAGVGEHEFCLLCSPISQTVGMHQAPFSSGKQLQLSMSEALHYCQTLSAFFETEHIRFVAARPTLWLMIIPQAWSFQIPSLWDLHGSMDKASKPSGVDAGRMLQLLTECQMLLFQHPLNKQRQQSGLAPINGLWLQNDLIGNASQSISLFANNDWSCSAQPLPVNGTTLLQQLAAAQTTHAVVFLDDLTTPVDANDAYAYAAILNRWEIDWFRPLQQALHSKPSFTLSLHTDGDQGGIMTIRKPWFTPFWRHRSAFNGQTL